MNVSKVQLKPNSPVPSARTYHASCLLGKYMIIVGGEANSDLKDFWALDLEESVWYKPDINFLDYYTPKRFHTVCTINDHQVITFGGCHSEYVHMNEMHIFDLQDFLQNPQDSEIRITCNKVQTNQGVPSTRWGHAASTYGGKLYIVGGRNEQDIIDLHEFDPKKMKWKELDIAGPLPKARRRHSSLFVNGSLVMFGGFDGNFFNDLNILDFQSSKKQIITIQPSSINYDYLSLVNQQENSDICFILDNNSKAKVFAHKPLVLFRLIQRELMQENYEDVKLHSLLSQSTTPDFIKSVYLSKQGDEIFLKGISCRTTFLKFLEFLYCDRFVEQTTTAVVRKISEICKQLHLPQSYALLKKKAEFAKMKLQQNILKELNAQQINQEPLQVNRQQSQQIKQKVEYLETTVKIDFSHVEDIHIQSPEDKQERLHNKALNHMNQCKNLDDFYDILFLVEDTLIKANSLVLSARCPYFKSMLSNKYSFQESKIDKSGYIKVSGVPKLYFSCIIQYIYSDHFYIQKSEVDFFVKLLIYADYFMLPRLIDICSSYLKQYVNVKSALQLLLIAHAHNADQLEKYCINFIAMNDKEIMEGRYFRSFKRQAQESLYQNFIQSISNEKEESYVQICIHNYLTKKNPQDNTAAVRDHQQDQLRRPSHTRYASSSGNLSQSNSRNQSGRLPIRSEEDIDIDELLNQSQYIYLEEHQKYESYDLNKLTSFKSNILQSSFAFKQQSFNKKTARNFQEEEIKDECQDENTNYQNLIKVRQQCLTTRDMKKQPFDYEDKENKGFLNNKNLIDKENINPFLSKQSLNQSLSKRKTGLQEMPVGKNGLQDNYGMNSLTSMIQPSSQSNNSSSMNSRNQSKRQPLKQVTANQADDDLYNDDIVDDAATEDLINNAMMALNSQSIDLNQNTTNCQTFQTL